MGLPKRFNGFTFVIQMLYFIILISIFNIWRPLNLSELTQILINIELIHLGSEASIYFFKIIYIDQVYGFFSYTLIKIEQL